MPCLVRVEQMSFQDVGQCSNLPLEESQSMSLFAGDNPSDETALGEYAHWQVHSSDFDSQCSSAREQRATEIANHLLIRAGFEALEARIKLDAPPSIYGKDNRVGDGSLHHDPRYREDPVYGPQPA